MFGLIKRRRERLRKRLFPEKWLEILRRNVPYYSLLSEQEQKELRELINVFVGEKQFIGCAGLEITDEIRVTIAAQACMLLLNRKTSCYSSLESILVYPHKYFVKSRSSNSDGTVTETMQARLGESWYRGSVVLAWDHVKSGAANVNDGENLVFHEFAHQLDNEDGRTDGSPLLTDRSMYATWAMILGNEYKKLCRSLARHRNTFIDQYGAKSPPEFFAVVTEAFFERPLKMQSKHPLLYDELKRFYRQDPAERYTKAQEAPGET